LPRKRKPVALEGTFEGYCVKCSRKRKMTDPVQVQFKNGTYAAQGGCPKCGTKLTRMIGREPIA
jgi:Domain of unknown function (DUF5679)